MEVPATPGVLAFPGQTAGNGQTSCRVHAVTGVLAFARQQKPCAKSVLPQVKPAPRPPVHSPLGVFGRRARDPFRLGSEAQLLASGHRVLRVRMVLQLVLSTNQLTTQDAYFLAFANVVA